MSLAGTASATAPTAVPLTSASCPTNITQGEVDGCVTQLQQLLNQHGARLAVDGNFGASTLAAVKGFQVSEGLTVDGIVGPNTKAKLLDSGGSVPTPIDLRSSSCPTYIEQGQTSGCVTELQDLLNDNGAHLVVDGNFGASTQAAVKSYQSSKSLSSDGIVGPSTKNTLYGTTPIPPGATNLLSGACPTLVEQGETDGCVRTLQSLLSAHGYSLTIDGDFGPNTLSAVKSFQKAAGLTVDGIVGPATKAALYGNGGNGNGSGSTGAPTPINLKSSSCPTDIQQGQISGCVTELQSLLNEAGAKLSVDGDFGPLTAAAVKNYQSAHGLSADGIVGPQTKNVLYGGSYTPPSAPPAGGNANSKIVTIANDIVNGTPVSAYKGGKIPYGWAGGHAANPGPSPADCAAGGGDKACWAATRNGTLGSNGTISLDCSGFVRWVYYMASGYDFQVNGGSATTQEVADSHGSSVSGWTSTSVGNAQPGDLIFFGNTAASPDHVGIYVGNGMIDDAPSTGEYVSSAPASYFDPIVAVKHYSLPGVSDPQPPGPPAPSAGVTDNSGSGLSTNYDWANLVLRDGGWATGGNNAAVITEWMAGENPPSSWWRGNNNPLDNGLGSGGGGGTGGYPDLHTAAYYVALNLYNHRSGTPQPWYGSIASDLQASAAPATTASAIINSNWSCGHYSGSTTCNTTGNPPWGAAWNHSTIATVAAPTSVTW